MHHRRHRSALPRPYEKEKAVKTPYIEIDLNKIAHNASRLKKMWGEAGIDVMGITKVDLGEPHLAQTLADAGITLLGDSRIEDIIRMKKAGVDAKFCLIRTPFLSDVKRVVRYADISLNTEFAVIKALNKEAIKQQKKSGHSDGGDGRPKRRGASRTASRQGGKNSCPFQY